MKLKNIFVAVAATALLSCGAHAQTVDCSFEGSADGFAAVNSSLSEGGSLMFGDGAIGQGLVLNGSYGLRIGEVGTEFSVGALVKITSLGDTKAIFFKNMGSKSSEKWLSVIADDGVPAFWANGGGFAWSRIATSEVNILNSWAYVVYTEKDGLGSLYIDGVLVGSGSVAQSGGTVYAGVTYWSADAMSGCIDEMVFDNEKAFSADEISALYEHHKAKLEELRYAAELEALSLPANVTQNISLAQTVGNKKLSWISSNTSAITNDGTVTRSDMDVSVVMTAYVNGVAVKSFNVTVLKLPSKVNDDVVLSYIFAADDEGVVADKSGNGNHGVLCGGMKGGVFDGTDDYVSLPSGIFSDLDEFTIIMRLVPDIAQTHQFTFGFGNSSSQGYFFLNTSRPTTKTIRLAITPSDYTKEKDIKSFPGLTIGQEAAVVITCKGSVYSMYIDGIPVAEGDLGMAVKDLGNTDENYLGKSLYSGDPYFKGEFKEFTVLPHAMDSAQIKDAYELPDETPTSYVDEFALTESGFWAKLNRFCMVSAKFHDKDGNEISCSVKKVSADNLTLNFQCENAAGAEITVFDANTGIIREKYAVALNGGILAHTVDNGSVKVLNSTSSPANVAVINALYSGDALNGAQIFTVEVAPGSFEIVPVDYDFMSSKIFVWSSLGEMRPLARID